MKAPETPVILLVEDDQSLVSAIQKKLALSGFHAAIAKSVEEAQQLLESLPRVDALWLDHYLIGKATGLDFVTALKSAGSAWKQLPIFVVSNTGSPDKVGSYLALGVDKYYTKSDHRLDEIIHDIATRLQK